MGLGRAGTERYIMNKWQEYEQRKEMLRQRLAWESSNWEAEIEKLVKELDL